MLRPRRIWGCAIKKGKACRRNGSEAVKWYRMAAEQGYTSGQMVLGLCYVLGRGVTKNREEAIRWFRKAADQGNEPAKEQLLDMGVSLNGQPSSK